MKSVFAIVCLIVLSACVNKPGSENTHGKNKAIKSSADTAFLKRIIFDTVYMGRPFHTYNAVYIDRNKNSDYYSQLADFSFTKFENLDSYTEEFKKRKKHFSKVNTTTLPGEWLPLYSYRNQYHLYIPSDWGDMMRLMLNDSLFIEWGM